MINPDPFGVCVGQVRDYLLQRYPDTPDTTVQAIAEANCLNRPDSGI
jgi:hypothetical protein